MPWRAGLTLRAGGAMRRCSELRPRGADYGSARDTSGNRSGCAIDSTDRSTSSIGQYKWSADGHSTAESCAIVAYEVSCLGSRRSPEALIASEQTNRLPRLTILPQCQNSSLSPWSAATVLRMVRSPRWRPRIDPFRREMAGMRITFTVRAGRRPSSGSPMVTTPTCGIVYSTKALPTPGPDSTRRHRSVRHSRGISCVGVCPRVLPSGA